MNWRQLHNTLLLRQRFSILHKDPQINQSLCSARQRQNLQPTHDYRRWLCDNKQWHHSLPSGTRGSISSQPKILLINPRRRWLSQPRTPGYTHSSIPVFHWCADIPHTLRAMEEKKKNRVIENKQDHNFFPLSVSWAKLFQWIDINTDSHEPMITLFMEHTC